MTVDPQPAKMKHQLDFYGNLATYFSLQESHTVLSIRVESLVAVVAQHIPVAAETPRWELAREIARTDLSTRGVEASEFLFDSPMVATSDDLAAFCAPSFLAGRPALEAIAHLNSRIQKEFKYVPQSTTVSTPVSEVLERRVGVCQDFAHLMIGCLRSIGIPARYVSGYLLTQPPPGKPRLVGADASHAWVSAYLPGFGWIDFDPTNGFPTRGEHITLAWGRDYSDVCPVRGVILGGGNQSLSVKVDVAAA